jgi:FkbM family methyltransferase
MTVRERFERVYGRFLRVATAGRGVAWQVDGRTRLRIDPRCRWIRNPSYEAAVVDYLRARVAPGDCCVDVGAHVGYYAMQMVLWTAPGGRVIAFEPNPLSRDVLVTNLRLNGFEPRVTVEPFAVSDAPGRAPLFHGDETTGLSRIGAPNPQSRGRDPAVEVELVTLDEYCARHAVSPRWVLIDAEGYELEVLTGARRLLADSRITFVVEMHADLWTRGRQATVVQLEELFRSCGRTALPITGQGNLLEDYGTIVLAGRTG